MAEHRANSAHKHVFFFCLNDALKENKNYFSIRKSQRNLEYFSWKSTSDQKWGFLHARQPSASNECKLVLWDPEPRSNSGRSPLPTHDIGIRIHTGYTPFVSSAARDFRRSPSAGKSMQLHNATAVQPAHYQLQLGQPLKNKINSL